MLSILADFGMTTMRLTLKSDATAAIGITQREGLGKVRHLTTADFWVQQRLRRNEFRILKVPGTENPADLGTKGVEHAAMLKHMRALGFVSLGGRPTAAPALKSKSF